MLLAYGMVCVVGYVGSVVGGSVVGDDVSYAGM